VIGINDGEMVFFGTGDRADPERTDVINRFYAVKNTWKGVGFTTLREDDLYDATDDTLVMGTAVEKANAETALNNASGWYINLEDTGEKMISSPLVYGGVVYFTTFVPDTGAAPPTDPCEGNLGSGSSYLYALDWKTGASVYEDFSNTDEYNPETGEVIKKGGKADRRKKIGEYIVSAPVIAIRNGVAMMYIGIPEGIKPEKPVSTMEMNLFYWRELMP
jgi:Tfp pilus tip-associated adhesin PilY1